MPFDFATNVHECRRASKQAVFLLHNFSDDQAWESGLASIGPSSPGHIIFEGRGWRLRKSELMQDIANAEDLFTIRTQSIPHP
jgi:hypothetical protein